jgi:hypothetical protein
MELQNICLTMSYQQKQGMAVGNSLICLWNTADHKPTKWLRYVDDTFAVWPHGPARLQQFLHCLNSITPTIKFTMEVEANDTLPFLDILVLKRGPKLAMKVYRKHTHTGCYLHPHHEKGESFIV